MLNLPPLPNLPLTAKVLITSFLLTIGIEYVNAGYYAQMQYGLTYGGLVSNFSETKKGLKVLSDIWDGIFPGAPKPAGQHLARIEKKVSEIEKRAAVIQKQTAEMEKHIETLEKTAPSAGETPMPGMENMGGEVSITLGDVQPMSHVVDLKMLIQDGHVHFFTITAMTFTMGSFLLWSQLADKWKLILIPIPFVCIALNFASMLLIKYVADGFAWLLLFSGAGLGLVFTFDFFLTFYELWLMPKKEARPC